jgi:hypothetical protein
MGDSTISATDNFEILNGSARAQRVPSAPGGPPAASATLMAEGPLRRAMLQRRFDVHCSGCGYGAVVESFPDCCPMCRGTGWKTVDAPRSPSPPWEVQW